MHKIAARYALFPFKHWLTTLALGPVFLFLYEATRSPVAYTSEVFGFLLLFLFFGALLSFPTFIVFYFLYLYLVKRLASKPIIKIIMTAEALMGLIITLWLMDGFLIADFYIPYAGAILASSFIFGIDKK